MTNATWTPHDEQTALAGYLASRVCDRALGRNEDECLRNAPRDVYRYVSEPRLFGHGGNVPGRGSDDHIEWFQPVTVHSVCIASQYLYAVLETPRKC